MTETLPAATSSALPEPAPFIPGEKFVFQWACAIREPYFEGKSRLFVPTAPDFQRHSVVKLPAGCAARLLVAGERVRLTDGTICNSSTAPGIQFICANDVGLLIGDRTHPKAVEEPACTWRLGTTELIFRITDGLHDMDEAKLLALYEGNFAKEASRECAWIRAASHLYFEKRQAGVPRAELCELALEVSRRMDEAQLQGRMEWDEETGVFLFFARGAEVEERDDFGDGRGDGAGNIMEDEDVRRERGETIAE